MRKQIILCTVCHSAFPPHSVADSDYTSLTMNLTFSATTANQTIVINASIDNVIEDPETFTLFLTSDDPAVMLQSVSRNVSINDTTSEYIYCMKETALYTEW